MVIILTFLFFGLFSSRKKNKKQNQLPVQSSGNTGARREPLVLAALLQAQGGWRRRGPPRVKFMFSWMCFIDRGRKENYTTLDSISTFDLSIFQCFYRSVGRDTSAKFTKQLLKRLRAPGILFLPSPRSQRCSLVLASSDTIPYGRMLPLLSRSPQPRHARAPALQPTRPP